MFKKAIFASVASMTLLLAACGTGGDSAGGESADSGSGSEETKVLKMGTAAEFPPFESLNTQGEPEGFDIDLANHIADELGYELKINDMKFDGLIGALQAGRIDIVLSGMSATDARKENVDFSTEYHRSGEMFITTKDSEFKTLEDLKGKKIGVQLGTIQEEGAKNLNEEQDLGFDIKALDNSGLLVQELLSGRVDAAYMDKSVAVGYIAEQDLGGFDDPTTSSPGMAVAFPKDSDLVDDVNEILAQMEEDGTLQELKDKWLSEEE